MLFDLARVGLLLKTTEYRSRPRDSKLMNFLCHLRVHALLLGLQQTILFTAGDTVYFHLTKLHHTVSWLNKLLSQYLALYECARISILPV